MIISRTPFRVSFFGGGTDYPAWYRQHGGAVLTATIDKYCYLTCRYLPPFFEHRFRIVYSKTELCQHVDEIAHPAVREILQFLDVRRGLEIHHDGDLPARSGIGSSSAFSVGLLHALYALRGQMAGKQQLAMDGIHIEQERLRENVGSQDQVAAAYGGINHVRFLPSGEIAVHPLLLTAERLAEFNNHLMLFFTGIKRTSSEVAATYANDLEKNRRQLRIAQDLVEDGLTILAGRDSLIPFGELLHEGWTAKREMSKNISSSEIDAAYEAARAAGAVGGKLLGAGGGGFMLLFVSPNRRADVREKLAGLLHVPFKFEFSGSQIVFCDRESDAAGAEPGRPALPAPIAAAREAGAFAKPGKSHDSSPVRPELVEGQSCKGPSTGSGRTELKLP